MRRLDESLTRLAERGDRTGADVLIERVEHRLELGTDPTVVALDPRRTDMQIQQETAPAMRNRGPWIAAAAFGVLIVVALAAIVVLQATQEEEALVAGQPPGALEEFVAALHNNDTEAALALVNQPNLGFLPWLVALDTSDVEFTDCALIADGRVQCSTTFGPNHFYSRISDDPMDSTFTALIENGRLNGPQWPPPDELRPAERSFEQWVTETYPERYSEMFTEAGSVEHIRFSAASGAARTELANEYLASR